MATRVFEESLRKAVVTSIFSFSHNVVFKNHLFQVIKSQVCVLDLNSISSLCSGELEANFAHELSFNYLYIYIEKKFCQN